MLSQTRFFCNEYFGVKSIKNVEKYANEVELDEVYHNNRPIKNGIIICPFYSVKINGKTVPVYSTRSAHGIHSFVYVNVEDKKEDFSLDIEIIALDKSSVLKDKTPKTVVLPLSNGVNAKVEKGKVFATINKTGSYSFAFNDEHYEPITFFVKYAEDKKEIFGDYEIKYISPDDYQSLEKREMLDFERENTVYYFTKGRYKIDTISLPSNSVLYLENGAYLEVMPSLYAGKNFALFTHDASNVKVAGRGIIDFSACCGGETSSKVLIQNKNGLMFRDSNNIDFSGVTIINCSSWTLNFVDCENVHVKDVMIYGYRVFSDGIMLSDCVNGLVEDCFVRTGDDAFETKSIGVNKHTDNILFRNNACWTDKAQGYGSIFECNHGTKNVRFENCSIGFALATWSDHVSCLVIQLGNLPNRLVHDIHFKNIEIYKSINASMLNLHIGGTGPTYFGYGLIDDIHFENVSIKINNGAVLRVRTCDEKNCKIGEIYLDNIVSNGKRLTNENLHDNGVFIDKVVGGYDLTKLHIG